MRAATIPILFFMMTTFFCPHKVVCAEPESINGDQVLQEEQLLLNHLDETGLLKKMDTAKSLRIYIGKALTDMSRYNKTFAKFVLSEDGLYPGPLLNVSRSGLSLDLYPIKDWLHVHMEYSVDAYLYLRFKNDFTVVGTAEEADLCFGYCDEVKPNLPWNFDQFPIFIVPRGKEGSHFHCNTMGFGFEDLGGELHPDCRVIAPYVHSVYSPSESAIAPWNLPLSRTNLLVFFGGVWRGERRKESVQEMEEYSKLHQNDTPEHFTTFFLAPKKIASHDEEVFVDTFFAQAWSTYAHSYFSWQPHGDSLTRRAFYDSLLFGCIPVISTKSAWAYKLLFQKHLFSGEHFVFEDIVVVLEHHVFTNGALILEHLSSISMEEMRRRQSKLRSIAPLMQWGWKTKHHIDPLLLVLATLMK